MHHSIAVELARWGFSETFLCVMVIQFKLDIHFAYLESFKSRLKSKLIFQVSLHFAVAIIFLCDKGKHKMVLILSNRNENSPRTVFAMVKIKSVLHQEEAPRHKVQVFSLKASWTPSNRDVVLTLYDGYNRAADIRKNLSSEALKGFKVESTQTPHVSTLGDLSVGLWEGFHVKFEGHPPQKAGLLNWSTM